MFITPAYAQTGGMSDPFTGLLIPMLVMVLIFYFLVIRPQQQRAKSHREKVDKVRRGDTVITSGGFIGKVTKAADNSDEIEVELTDDMRVRVLKSTLLDVRGQGRAGQGTLLAATSRQTTSRKQIKRSQSRCCTSNAGKSLRSCWSALPASSSPCPTCSPSRRSRAGRRGCPIASSRSASTCAAAPISCSQWTPRSWKKTGC